MRCGWGIPYVTATAAIQQPSVFHPPGKKKKKTRGDHFKLRFRKNFQALLEEQVREGSAWGQGTLESKVVSEPLLFSTPGGHQLHGRLEN